MVRKALDGPLSRARISGLQGHHTKIPEERLSNRRHGKSIFFFNRRKQGETSIEKLVLSFLVLSRRAGDEGAALSGAWRSCVQLREVILKFSILAKPDGSWSPQPPQPHTRAAHLDLRSTCLQITPAFCLVQQPLFPLPRDVIRPSEFACTYYEPSCVLSWCWVSVAVITYIY